MGGYNEPPVFLDFLTKALEKARGGMKVTQASPHIDENVRAQTRGAGSPDHCTLSLDNCQRTYPTIVGDGLHWVKGVRTFVAERGKGH